MKKLFAIVALSLVIAGSMAAGTMAQYQKTQSVAYTQDYKEFNFIATNTTSDTTLAVKMAPGETKSWTFNVSNTENNVFSETDMLVLLGLTSSNIPNGISFYINDELYIPGAQITVAALQGGRADSTSVTLKAVWNGSDNSNDTYYEGSTGNIYLSLTATQASENEFAPLITNVSEQIIPSNLKIQGSKVGNVFQAKYNVNTLSGNIHIRPAFTITGVKDPSKLSIIYNGGVINGAQDPTITYFVFNAPVGNVFNINSGSQIFFPRATDIPAKATYTISYNNIVIGTYIVDLVLQ